MKRSYPKTLHFGSALTKISQIIGFFVVFQESSYWRVTGFLIMLVVHLNRDCLYKNTQVSSVEHLPLKLVKKEELGNKSY